MDWRIEKRRSLCLHCQHEFGEGERHLSLLAVSDEGLVREDRCVTCWRAQTEGKDSEAPAAPLFWWFTRHRGERKKTLQLDLETLERLFLQLEGHEERAVRELRYLLCLLLMRKRRLKVVRVDRGREGESFVVKRPRRDERYRVFVFDFEAERLAELRTQLQAIFDGAEPEAADLSAQAASCDSSGEEQDDASDEGREAGDETGAGSEPVVDPPELEATASSSTASDA